VEWWGPVIGALIVGLVLGGLRLAIRLLVNAGLVHSLGGLSRLLDLGVVRLDGRSWETFHAVLVLPGDRADAEPLLSDALDAVPRLTRSAPGVWSLAGGVGFDVGLIETSRGLGVAAVRLDLRDGAPLYPLDYRGVLRRVRRAARRAGVTTLEARLLHEVSDDGRVARMSAAPTFS
jgi:hypothetical protein